MAKFRFQDLEIWQLAIDLGDKLLYIADALEHGAKRKTNAMRHALCALQGE